MFRKTIQKLLILYFVVGLSCVPSPRSARQPLSFFLVRAEPLIAERQYSQAIQVLEDAAQVHSNTPLPLIKIGQIYLSQERWLLAEDAFNRALAHDLDNPIAKAGLAEAVFNQSRFTEALGLWQEVVATHPQVPGAFTGLGRTYLWLFDFEAAKEAFLSQQRYSNDSESQWFLAAMEAPVDLSAAIDYLQAISPSRLDDAKKDAPTGLLARRDYLVAALEPFTDDSSQTEIAKATGIALAQIELWPLAVHALTIALEKSGTANNDAELLAFLGHALAQAGRPALELFEQAQQADPTSALPLYFQGQYLRRQNALNAAEALFEQAIGLDPENAAIYVELAQTKAEQGDIGTAEGLYLAAIEVSGDDLQFQILLARFYAERGFRIVEAGIPTAEAIIEQDEDNAEAYDLLGWMQVLSGASQEGEAALHRALEIQPGLIRARYHLARHLEAQGQPQLARAEYWRVIDWDASGVYRDQAIKDLQRLGTNQ